MNEPSCWACDRKASFRRPDGLACCTKCFADWLLPAFVRDLVARGLDQAKALEAAQVAVTRWQHKFGLVGGESDGDVS